MLTPPLSSQTSPQAAQLLGEAQSCDNSNNRLKEPGAIADFHPDDACRTCRGSGWQTYPSSDRYGDQRTLTEPCMACGGTGAK